MEGKPATRVVFPVDDLDLIIHGSMGFTRAEFVKIDFGRKVTACSSKDGPCFNFFAMGGKASLLECAKGLLFFFVKSKA
jgi:hypothetical protein